MKDLLAAPGAAVDRWQAFGSSLLRIALILALAWLLHALARRLIRAFRSYMAGRAPHPDEARRIETLGRVFRYLATVIIAIVAGTLVLGELGVSIAPILATAGVAGLAVGIAAQSLIRDYLNGFFLLIEDQLRQGDLVEIGAHAGQVEEMTLRYVKLRNAEGHVIYVPNAEVKVVKNLTREYARALVEVGVAPRADVDQALEIMREVGRALRADPEFGPKIAEEVEPAGVERWTESALVLRARLKVTPPAEQAAVRREYLRRLKRAFDARGIELAQRAGTLAETKGGAAPGASG